MKRVLVTGATGFVGRHTLSHLHTRGFEVHAVTRGQPIESDGTTWYTCDLFDDDQVADLLTRTKPTHLLHIAWYVAHGAFWNAPENLHCVQSSLTLFEHFRRNGGHRITVAGTCFEYDLAHGWLSEGSTPTGPHTLYGTAKDSLRRLLESSLKDSEVTWAWGRIFFPYGPHEGPNRLVPSVVGALLKGEATRCSPGTQIRDFMHVDDVALALVAVLDSSCSGPTNICSGDPVAIKDVVVAIGEEVGCPNLVRLGDLPLGNQPPFLVGDSRKLHAETDFRGGRSLAEGIAETVNWWRGRPT